MSAVDTAVESTLSIDELRRRLKEEVDRRDNALIAMHFEDDVPKTRIGQVLRARLRNQGYTQEFIETLGISDWSIRNVLDRTRIPVGE